MTLHMLFVGMQSGNGVVVAMISWIDSGDQSHLWQLLLYSLRCLTAAGGQGAARARRSQGWAG